MAVLQQTTGSASRPVFRLIADSIRIGRQFDCEILLQSEDVSRYHARVYWNDGRYLLEDLGSRNGTELNRISVEAPAVLQDGDEIAISSVRFTFLEQAPFLTDSSLPGRASSGEESSAINLSSGLLSSSIQADGAEPPPLVVRQGDRIPFERFESCELNSKSIVTRVPTGNSQTGWPTLKQPEDKLLDALRMQDRFRGIVSQQNLLTSAIDFLFDVFGSAETIVVILRGEHTVGLTVAAAGSRREDDEIHVSVPLLISSMESGESILCVEHQQPNPETDISKDGPVVRYLLNSVVAGPDGSVQGAVQMETRQPGGFEPPDVERLAILSHVISCQLDVLAATSQAAQQELFGQSVEAAQRLHRYAMPVNLPQVAGFHVQHHLMTVPDVAADLVAYVPLSNGRLGCFILDVPGRCLDAAGLMSAIGPVVTQALMTSASPAAVIRKVEEEVDLQMPQFPMITSLCVAVLDPKHSVVTVSIAGHCPAWWFRQGTVEGLSDQEMNGPPLGTPRDVCAESEFSLADDDVLLLCSDGIACLPIENGTLESCANLAQLLQLADMDCRTGLGDRIIKGLQSRLGTRALKDDLVLLAIHKTNVDHQSAESRLPLGDTQVPR